MTVFSRVSIHLTQICFIVTWFFVEVNFDRCRMNMQRSAIDSTMFLRASECVSSAELTHVSQFFGQFLGFLINYFWPFEPTF